MSVVPFDPELSTNDNLAAHGLRPGRFVLDERGRVVFVGTCYDCNDWLRAGRPAQEVAS